MKDLHTLCGQNAEIFLVKTVAHVTTGLLGRIIFQSLDFTCISRHRRTQKVLDLIPHYPIYRTQFSPWRNFCTYYRVQKYVITYHQRICDFLRTLLIGVALLNNISVFRNREADFTCSVWKWYLIHVKISERQSIKVNDISHEYFCLNMRCEWRHMQCCM